MRNPSKKPVPDHSENKPTAASPVRLVHDAAQALSLDAAQALELREPPETQAIGLADGATVRVLDGRVAELRDASDRLLIRYENGRAEIAAPAGDLVLAAPSGRVVVRAGTDVVIEAARDLTQIAGHRAEVKAERLDVSAAETRLTTGQAAVVAERILTTARVLASNVEQLEVSATRLIEKTRESYREAADLLQIRAGRLRTLVADVYSLHAGRTAIVSKEETSIDGKKVLLG